MNLNECIEKYEIIEELQDMSITYQDKKTTFKVNDKFNKLIIVKLVSFKRNSPGAKTNRILKGFIAKCDCGNYIGPNMLRSLLNGDSMSCGCHQRELHSKQLSIKNFKHGDSIRENKSKLYITWCAMYDRITNKNRIDSKWYSDKNLEFFEDWKDYKIFKEWAINNGYEEGLSIDRIDNGIGYIPSNCHWIELKDQNKNKTNNRLITLNGETKILEDWCKFYNLNSKNVSSRLSRGWSIEKALEII